MGTLSLVIFLPLVGAALIALVPGKNPWVARWIAILTCIADFALSIPLLTNFDSSRFQFQFVEKMWWMKSMGIQYHVGIDGLSLWLILLTTFLGILAVWFSFYVKDRVKEYMIFMLMLQTGMLGVFCALDMVLFYTFWEAMLIPMYFLIGIWGGDGRRYAAIKFFLYTFAGSIFMLLAIIGLYVYSHGSFNLIDLQRLAANGQLVEDSNMRFWMFMAFAVAFAIKVPMFPLHTWLPDAHTEAPTAGSVILAGVLLKMGTYGFFRFCMPLFPDTSVAAVPWIMVISVIGIIYGAVVAAVQVDVKRLVAYSSVSHLAFVTLGLFSLNPAGMTGAMLQQINHGISTGALFLLIGMIYERRHTRLFSEFGGLKEKMPVFAALFLIFMLSSVGLPSLNGFVGEFLSLFGAFQTTNAGLFGTSVWMGVLAAGGVILAAVYLLWMFQKMFYGKVNNPKNEGLQDLKMFERVILASLAIFVFWLGLYPTTLTSKMEVSVQALRMQVVLPEGQKPLWSEEKQVVTREGTFVPIPGGKAIVSLPSHANSVIPTERSSEPAKKVVSGGTWSTDRSVDHGSLGGRGLSEPYLGIRSATSSPAPRPAGEGKKTALLTSDFFGGWRGVGLSKFEASAQRDKSRSSTTFMEGGAPAPPRRTAGFAPTHDPTSGSWSFRSEARNPFLGDAVTNAWGFRKGFLVASGLRNDQTLAARTSLALPGKSLTRSLVVLNCPTPPGLVTRLRAMLMQPKGDRK